MSAAWAWDGRVVDDGAPFDGCLRGSCWCALVVLLMVLCMYLFKLVHTECTIVINVRLRRGVA